MPEYQKYFNVTVPAPKSPYEHYLVFKEILQDKSTFDNWHSAHQERYGFSWYATEIKKTGEMIGCVGLLTATFEAHFTPAIEIGWRLSSEHWNKGYATEAAKAVLDYAFNEIKLDEVVSFTPVLNKPSIRVMQKIGLHTNKEDDFDNPNVPAGSPLIRHVLYRLTRSEL